MGNVNNYEKVEDGDDGDPDKDRLQNCNLSWNGNGDINASQICIKNITWQLVNNTDYNSSNLSFQEAGQVGILEYFLLLIPYLVSILLLTLALLTFFYFRRCIWCDRVALHTHLMLALVLRSWILMVIPILQRGEQNYHKILLSIDLYATLASINWTFLQYVYLKGRWTNCRAPFRQYLIIGWVLPLLLLAMFSMFLHLCLFLDIYFLIWPMFIVLSVNLLLLSNIRRVLCTPSHRDISNGQVIQRAVEATFILFPLLGLHNLIFFRNPVGNWNKLIFTSHAVFGSSQAVLVPVFYCFLTRPVRSAIFLECSRFCGGGDEVNLQIHFRSSTQPDHPITEGIQDSDNKLLQVCVYSPSQVTTLDSTPYPCTVLTTIDEEIVSVSNTATMTTDGWHETIL